MKNGSNQFQRKLEMRLIQSKIFILLSLILLICNAYSQQYNESNDFSYALKLYNENFFDIAAQQFSIFINRYPGSERLPDARYYYGDALYKLGDIENARIEFQGMAVSYPENSRAPEAWLMVGECYRKLKKPEEAAKAYETVKVLYPKNALAPKALLSAIESYMEVGRLTRAEQVAREFLDRYIESSEYPRGRIMYGKVLVQKQEFEKAANEFQKAIELTSDKIIQAEARLGEAKVYEQLGLVTRSITTLENIIKNHSGSDPAYEATIILTEIYQNGRQWDNAITLLKRESSKYSATEQKNQLRLLLAQTYFLAGDYFNARKTLSEISGADAKQTSAADFYTACCELEENRLDNANSAFRSLLTQIDQGSAGKEYQTAIVYNLANLHLRQGNIQQARHYITLFGELGPNDPNLETLNKQLVELALNRNSLLAGVDELQRFKGAFPNSFYRDELVYLAGEAFFKDRQYERSLLFFEQISNEYVCSAKWDSSMVYIDFIKSYLTSGSQAGVNELAKLMGRMLTGVNRKELMFELGKIYLTHLRDFEEAARIFERYISESPGDSSAVGEGLYYLSECYFRLAEYKRVLGLPTASYEEKAVESLKKAVARVRYAPYPDTLTYRFLMATTPAASTPPDKQITFWQHFVQSYPNSGLLPRVQLQLADAYITISDYTKAITYLDQIIAGKKDYYISGKAYWKKAEILEKQGNLDLAIQTLKDFLLEYTRHPYQAGAYWKLGEYHAMLGDYSTAAKFLERILELFNYSDYAAKSQSQTTEYYILNGEYSKALAYVGPKLSGYQNPEDVIVRHYLASPPADFYFYAGKAYYQENQFAKSRGNFLNYLTFTRDGAFRDESLLLLGKMAQAEEDYESALVQYSLVKKEEGSIIFYQANKNAADILFKQGKYSEAYEKYNMLNPLTTDSDERIDNDAQKIRCLINLNRGGEYRSQLSAFKNTYGKHPRLKTYLAAIEYENGKLAYANKNFDRAINHCKTVLGKYKNTEYADNAQYLIVRSYATLNREKDALKELDKFLKTYPNSDLLSDTYLVVAQVHFRAERNDDGLDAVRKAVDAASDPVTKKAAMSMLISTYKNLGLWDGVYKVARDYIAAYPNADDLVDKKITAGIALIRLNRYVEAIDYLRGLKAEVSSEQEPEIQFYIGEAYFNAGQYENAINEFVKIPLLSQKTKLQWEASAFYFAGQSYERLGRRDDAIRMYQEIVNRPGIEYDLKRQAQQLIDKLKAMN
jgi:tol-pal system protein YbgF